MHPNARRSRSVALSFALLMAACGGDALPTPPSASEQLLFDPSLSGTAFLLTGFDVGTFTFSFQNNQGTFEVAFDNDTMFRRPQFSPGAPYSPECQAAIDTYVDPLNSDSFLLALQAYATSLCNARIVLTGGVSLPPSPILPPNPIRIVSFQPIP